MKAKRSRRWAFAVLLWVLLGTAAIADDNAGEVRVYVANLIHGATTLWVQCPGETIAAVEPGRVHACRTAAPTELKLGLTDAATAPLDPTVEDHFAVTDGAGTLSGSRETMIGLAPGRNAYFVYVWCAESGSR